MKKIIFVFAICLLCIGCSKNEKNITINIYENSDTNEIKDEIKVEESYKLEDKNTTNPPEESNQIKQTHDSNSQNNVDEEYTFDKITNKVKDTYNTAKTWYDTNKDEIKDINSDIIENDKNNIDGFIDKTTTWYEENKEELKQESLNIYNNDKQTIEDLYNKIKN